MDFVEGGRVCLDYWGRGHLKVKGRSSLGCARWGTIQGYLGVCTPGIGGCGGNCNN
jgi:hypothetical protein